MPFNEQAEEIESLEGRVQRLEAAAGAEDAASDREASEATRGAPLVCCRAAWDRGARAPGEGAGESGCEAMTESESLARRFHEAYERLAPEFGYETRRATAKPWEDVPEYNRRLMIATVEEVTRGLREERDNHHDTAALRLRAALGRATYLLRRQVKDVLSCSAEQMDVLTDPDGERAGCEWAAMVEVDHAIRTHRRLSRCPHWGTWRVGCEWCEAEGALIGALHKLDEVRGR